MASGSQVGTCYRKFQPPLHKHILRNDYDAIRYILSSHHRDCINDMDHDGRNAFHLALQTANSKALYLLLYYPFVHTNQVFATLDWTCDSDDEIDRDIVHVGNAKPAYQAGDRLLMKWNETPDLYKKAAFSALEGYSIRGCGLRIVEDLYEQHYKYILDKPNTLERSAREYTAKYARLYSKEINFPEKIETIDELKEKNYISTIITSEIVMEKDDNTRVSFASDFIDSCDNFELQPIPLETVDLLVSFDMTSPIHLLFSNIYIESYREKILDCLKILITFFRVFDHKETVDSVKCMHLKNIEKRDCSSSLLEMMLRKNDYLKPMISWNEFISYRDHTLSTVLHRACQVKSGELVSMLLKSGFDPLAINENGELPVHLAVDSLDPDLFKTILDATLVAIFAKYEDESAEICKSSIVNQNSLQLDRRILSAIGNTQVLLKLLDGLLTCDNNSSKVRDGSRAEMDYLKNNSQKDKIFNNKLILKEDHTFLKQVPGEVIFERLFSKYGECFITTISSLFSELLLFFEQLFYRCIHRNSWRVFLALASFNNTLTFHMFSSPLCVHRFIKFAHSMGNVYAFFSILNYSVRLLYPNETKCVENMDFELGDMSMTFNRRNVKVEKGQDKITPAPTNFAQYNNNKTEMNSSSNYSAGIGSKRGVDDIKQIVNDYRGCGYPETPLRRVKIPCKPFSKFENINLSNFEGCNVNQLLSNASINKRTWIITHPICLEHLAIPEPTDMPQRRKKMTSNFVENPTRLEVIISNDNAILRTDILEGVYILQSPPPACLADILRVHDIGYINKLLQHVDMAKKKWQATPFSPVKLDQDTGVTPHSWTAARYAAGAVIAAVDAVCNGSCTNAFCAIRPPGHHLGTWGAAQASNTDDEDMASGSQGFCLINNVAIGAAYAKYRYGNNGIKRIAIVDFDLHHGNGTEQIIRNIGPKLKSCEFLGTCTCREEFSPDLDTEKQASQVHSDEPLCLACQKLKHPMWFGWRDTDDGEDIFFASIHAYDGEFYPGTGSSESSQYADDGPRIINVGVPKNTTSADFRTLFETNICPYLLHFSPDLIFISAGFDGHYRDSVNVGFTHYRDRDFFYVTERLQSIANATCGGKVVSVLEGGYNTRLNSSSPFAQSVLQHVIALAQTNKGMVYPLMFPLSTVKNLMDSISVLEGILRCDKGIVEKANFDLPSSHLYSMDDMTNQISELVESIYSKKCCISHILRSEDRVDTINSEYNPFYSGNAWYSFFCHTFQPIECDDDIRQNNNSPSPMCIPFDIDSSTINLDGNNMHGKFIPLFTDPGYSESQELTHGHDVDWIDNIKFEIMKANYTCALLLKEFFTRYVHLTSYNCKLHCDMRFDQKCQI
ncbi:histone deacetylase HOS3 [Babesia microti strain RI]|uniref:Histone deacetylase HOS3 n=1 Tax=Babesia microti (strain RI) TaxID=1133968 RepID=A0A1N6LWP9_BABMR|nr:histone deacetylase HOS3 [Babesia microti strain RI]SIO73292.1 histone deacetylase HOS3 [Babesia microti strain RI]|eukprot:XP_021337396.1 histone deacetylase HOS3 [Babesia microti strain RI]